MEEKSWIRLDNASNIFVAARNDTDTKVFRLTAEMTETINPVLLQKALIDTYKDYPLFHNVLRRGFFWYYLEAVEKNPQVSVETEPPCSPIYHYDKREFLFRVLYRENQVHLEVFHALTDGTGALWFFEDLLIAYIRLLNPTEQTKKMYRQKREKTDLEDSFNRYFSKSIKTQNFFPAKIFDKRVNPKNFFIALSKKISKKTYQIRGQRTPDHRLRIIKMNLAVNETLMLARKENVSLTVYLAAIYVLSVYQAKEEKNEETTISISIPINLRQFFPSLSVRNFFSTTTISYTFEKNEIPNLSLICEKLNEQFQKQLKTEAIENRLKRFISFEYNPFIRIVLRPIKDLILKIVNHFNNRSITIAMSNLGVINLPDGTADYIENFYFYTSVIRPQFCIISYKDVLNISFTSPFVETQIYHYFIQNLSEKGIEVTVDSNKVTDEEMLQ